MKEFKNNIVKRGMLALEAGEFIDALAFFNQALNEDAECSEAYFGQTLCAMQCRGTAELIALGLSVDDEKSYQYACRFADDEQKKEYERISNDIRETARKKAFICLDNSDYAIALKWFTRLGEQDGEYGLFCQIGIETDGFTEINGNALKRSIPLANKFVEIATTDQLITDFKEKWQVYADKIKEAQLIQEQKEEAKKKKKEQQEKEKRERQEKEEEEKKKAEAEKIIEEQNKKLEEEKAAKKEKREKESRELSFF